MSETRKLATIVALDIAGYSAPTEADGAKTTAEVAVLRKVIEGMAANHGGRVFNTAGDGSTLKPYRWYLDLVLAGGNEHGLPPKYLSEIMASVAPIEDANKREMKISGPCSEA